MTVEMEYFDDSTTVIKAPSQCDWCAHRLQGRQCSAFPQGIPDALYQNRADHRRPFADDHGIRWEWANLGLKEKG